MSLGACIPDMLKRGEIDPVRAKRMTELFKELEAHYRASMGPDAAAAEASEATLRQLANEQRLKKRQTLLQINRQRAALKEIEQYRGGAGYGAIRALFDRDTNAPYGNVVIRQQQIVNGAHAQLREFLERHRRNWIGKPREAEGLRNVVREMMGQDSGDAMAKPLAEAVADVVDQLRRRFNAAGGAIGRLDGWFPQRWSASSVRKVSKEEFVAAMLPELDRARMIDNRTGAAMTDQHLAVMLGDIHETIRTDGMTGEPSAALRGAGKLANQRAEHRVLHFKDADAWLRMNDRFGSEHNPFNAVMGHIDGMAHDIAMMERLGPNPDATVRYLLDSVDKKTAATDDPDALTKIGGGRALTEKMYRFLKGEGRDLIHPDSLLFGPPIVVTRTIEGGKNLMTAMRLGSATVSAIADLNTQRKARGFNGLRQAGMLRDYLSQLTRRIDRETAIELELGMRDAAQSLATLARWGVETERAGWTAVLADDVLRASGLNKVTEAGQRAYGMNALRDLARLRTSNWGALPADLRAGLERYGIGNYDWQAIRYSPGHVDPRGVERVKAGNITDASVRAKVMDWVLGETAAAVQEASLTTRMAMTVGERGSWTNLTAGTIMQFKAFGIGTMIEQGRRAASQGKIGGALYLADLFIGGVIVGAAIVQLREIIKGKDPQPMDNPTFWARAGATGGAAGYIGDVVANLAGTLDSDRVDGVGSIALGPLGSFGVDLVRAGKMAMPGKERQDGTHREANPIGAALYLARRDTPGLSSGWYTRGVWDELVIDRLAQDYDPQFSLTEAREAKRDQKNRQGRWLNGPDGMRMPDWGNALGNEGMM